MENKNQTKAEEMRLHIEACSRSGLAVTDYCTQNGLVKSNYYYWVKKLKGENKPSGFTAVSVATDARVEVTYPNGVQLSYRGAINATVIKTLICCI
jgi:hypothetical protein